MSKAIIDLGSNTFHLMIIQKNEIVYSTSKPTKLGQEGMSENIISEKAFERAFKVLSQFKLKLEEYSVENIWAFGTSALRNATNSGVFIDFINEKLGINIKIISGQEEAKLIYLGVIQAITIKENSLIVDIGGGSVEMIICNSEKILWLQSFEIGAWRLMEKFMKSDPISYAEINKLNDYLEIQLLPLTNALHQYHCHNLIGSSGTFDTLNDLYYMHTFKTKPPKNVNDFAYSITEFSRSFENIVFSTHNERLAMPGMKEFRVDLIVVSVCLIQFLLKKYPIKTIEISNFALKEGAMTCI